MPELFEVVEISEKEYMERYEKEKPLKIRKWKDPKNHNHDLQIKGSYTAIVIYCQTCHKGYRLPRGKVEEL